MRRAGVLRIRNFSELYVAASTLGVGVRVAGRRVAIVSNAGGPGALAADHAKDRRLQLATLEGPTLERLASLLPPSAHQGMPVYVRGDAEAQHFSTAARLCLEDPGVDALLAILTPHALTDPDAFARQLIETAADHRKPLFTCWMGGDAVAESRTLFSANKIPTYATPEAAVETEEVAEGIAKGQMPLPYYTILHPEARLSAKEKGQLTAGLMTTLEGSDAELTTDDLNRPDSDN